VLSVKKGVLEMKMKITEHNGALMVSVQSPRQELVICEEGGGFTFELRGREEGRVWWEEPCEVKVPAFPEMGLKEEIYQVNLPTPEPDSDMFKKLSQLRREIAYASGLPPYMVFHDKALRLMAETMPQNLAAFGKISGVGQAKLEKYGERFLAVINGAAA